MTLHRCQLSALMLAAALLLTACASNPRVFSDFDPRFDFTDTSTFSWVQTPPMLKAGDYPVSALAQQRMTDAIRDELIHKGYTFVEYAEQADLSVVYTMGAREKIDIVRYASPYYSHRYDWGWGAYYYPHFVYYPFGRDGPWREELRVSTQGTIAIDIFDAKTRKPIWHSKASKRLSKKDLNSSAIHAADIATQLLEHFPVIGCEPQVSDQCRPFPEP